MTDGILTFFILIEYVGETARRTLQLNSVGNQIPFYLTTRVQDVWFHAEAVFGNYIAKGWAMVEDHAIENACKNLLVILRRFHPTARKLTDADGLVITPSHHNVFGFLRSIAIDRKDCRTHVFSNFSEDDFQSLILNILFFGNISYSLNEDVLLVRNTFAPLFHVAWANYHGKAQQGKYEFSYPDEWVRPTNIVPMNLIPENLSYDRPILDLPLPKFALLVNLERLNVMHLQLKGIESTLNLTAPPDPTFLPQPRTQSITRIEDHLKLLARNLHQRATAAATALNINLDTLLQT
jgi:hypothetical protein